MAYVSSIPFLTNDHNANRLELEVTTPRYKLGGDTTGVCVLVMGRELARR